MWGKEVMISRVIPLSCSVQNVERHFPPTTPKTPFPDRQQATTPVPGFGYSYVASQEGRTPAQLEDSVNALVDGIVDVKSKNGVTLLGVAPRAGGTFPDSQIRILSKLGEWMRLNKEALHGADRRIPCQVGSLRFTRKAGFLYVIDELPDPLPADYAWVFKIRLSHTAEEIRQHIPATEYGVAGREVRAGDDPQPGGYDPQVAVW